MTYYVTYKITANYIATVNAENLKDAKRFAKDSWYEAEFGDAVDIDGEQICVEDEDGNILWEK